MNSSLITADRTTHLKILTLSALAATFVVWVGIAARLSVVEDQSTKQKIERLISVPITPHAATRSAGTA